MHPRFGHLKGCTKLDFCYCEEKIENVHVIFTQWLKSCVAEHIRRGDPNDIVGSVLNVLVGNMKAGWWVGVKLYRLNSVPISG